MITKHLPLILMSAMLGVVTFMYTTKIVIHLVDDPSIRVEYPLRKLFVRGEGSRSFDYLSRIVTCKLELMRGAL